MRVRVRDCVRAWRGVCACFRPGGHATQRYVGCDGTTLEGTFVNGVLEGPGTRSTDNGYVWEGTFLRGKLHGKGVLRHKARRVVAYYYYYYCYCYY